MGHPVLPQVRPAPEALAALRAPEAGLAGWEPGPGTALASVLPARPTLCPLPPPSGPLPEVRPPAATALSSFLAAAGRGGQQAECAVDAAVLAEVGGQAERQAAVRCTRRAVGGVGQRWAGRDQGLAKALRRMEHWWRLGARPGAAALPGRPSRGRRHGCAWARPWWRRPPGSGDTAASVGLQQDLLLLLPPSCSASSALAPPPRLGLSPGPSGSRAPALGPAAERARLARGHRLGQRCTPPLAPRLPPRLRRRGAARRPCPAGPQLGLSCLLGRPVDGQLDAASLRAPGPGGAGVAPARGRCGQAAQAQRGLRPVATQVAGRGGAAGGRP